MNDMLRGVVFLAQEGASRAPRTLIDYVHAGGFLSYVFVLISIAALALILRSCFELRLAALAPRRVIDGLRAAITVGGAQGAREFCADPANSSFLARVSGGALERAAESPLGMMELRPALAEVAQSELDRLHRLNDGIGIFAAVGPMLGLLGTVIGMIGAFGAIGSLQGAARSSELAKFMSIALVNTAEGLIVAIPCSIAFAMLRRRAVTVATQAGEIAERLVGPLDAGAIGAPAAPVRSAAPAAMAGMPRVGAP